MQLAVTIVQVLLCVAIVVIVTLQSGENQGLGVIAGGDNNFMNKTKGKSLDAKLTKATKWVALVFAVLTVALNCI